MTVQEIEHTRNILEFTLGIQYDKVLGYIRESLTDKRYFGVDDTLSHTWEVCESYLSESNFFGMDEAKELYNLAYMNTDSYRKQYWKEHINQHVVLKAYDYLRSQLLYRESRDISIYHLLQMYVGEKPKHNIKTGGETAKRRLTEMQGTSWLMKEKRIELKEMQLRQHTDGCENVSNKTSGYSKRVNHFLKYIPNEEDNKTKKGRVLLRNAEILAVFANHKSDVDNIIETREGLKENTVDRYVKAVHNVRKYIMENAKYLRSDKIYLLNQFEELFDAELCDCLYQNIIHLQRAKKMQVISQADVDNVAACSLLTNNLTRKYYLQMAVDSLLDEKNWNRFPDFFTSAYLYSKSWGSYLDDSKRIFAESEELSEWDKQYKRFIKYLTTLVFPLFESCFFIALYDSLDMDEKKENSDEVYTEMYRMLEQYINDNDLFRLEKNERTKPEQSDDHKQFGYPKSEVIEPWEHDITDKTLYCKCIAAVKKCKKNKRKEYLLKREDIKNTFSNYERALSAWYIINCGSI